MRVLALAITLGGLMVLLHTLEAEGMSPLHAAFVGLGVFGIVVGSLLALREELLDRR